MQHGLSEYISTEGWPPTTQDWTSAVLFGVIGYTISKQSKRWSKYAVWQGIGCMALSLSFKVR